MVIFGGVHPSWTSRQDDIERWSYEYLKMGPHGKWLKSDGMQQSGWNEETLFFLCQQNTAIIPQKGLTRIEVNKEQPEMFPFFVLHKTQAAQQQIQKSSKESGFSLDWFLADKNGTRLTEKLPTRPEDWRPYVTVPMYERPEMLDEMIEVARQLRLQNMTQEQSLEKVIQEKIHNIAVLEEENMCSMGQANTNHLHNAFSEVFLVDEKMFQEPVTNEDIKIGFGLFYAIVYCPRTVLKLHTFVDQLLSTETTRTIILTVVNLFKSGVLKHKTKLNPVNKFYFELASTLHLQFGNVLLATAPKSEIQAVLDNDWPFFTNTTELVKACLQDSDCDQIQDVLQQLGNHSDQPKLLLH